MESITKQEMENKCYHINSSGIRIIPTCILTLSAITLMILVSFPLTPHLHTQLEAPEAAWINHLCPRYHIRKYEGYSRLTWKPLSEDSIFFMQTSCSQSLSSREACVLESVALHNPRRPIRLLMTAPFVNITDPLFQVILRLSNVELSWLDLDEIFSEEPLFSWHKRREWLLNDARAPTFVSDSGRLELLRRYGGTYLDLDVIALQSLPAFTDWLGWHGAKQINNAVLSISKGHPFLETATSSIPKIFDPTSCCSLGPNLLFETMCQMCSKVCDADPEEHVKCNNLTVFARKRLYPFSPYNELDYIFLNKTGKALDFFDGSNDSWFLHLYSSHTAKVRIPLGNSTLLGDAAMRNCPRIYDAIVSQGLQL